MTDFTLDLMSNGEELKSVVIQLKVQWPQMRNCVHLSCLVYVAQRGSVPTFRPTVRNEDDAAALAKVECELEKSEGDGQKEQIIAEIDSTTSDLDVHMIREICNEHKRQEAERTKRKLEEGTISYVQAKWCCRCKIATGFPEGKCDQP